MEGHPFKCLFVVNPVSLCPLTPSACPTAQLHRVILNRVFFSTTVLHRLLTPVCGGCHFLSVFTPGLLRVPNHNRLFKFYGPNHQAIKKAQQNRISHSKNVNVIKIIRVSRGLK